MTQLTDITTTHETVTQTAARLRVALREQFLGVKFGVRSSRFAGGTSIAVSWTDGPTYATVAALTQGFANSALDVTGDFMELVDPTLYAGRDGELTHIQSGATFVSESRSYSPQAREAAAAEISAAAGQGQPFDAQRMYRVSIFAPAGEPDRPAEAVADECAFETGGLLVCELLAHRDLRAA